jgi:integrase
MLQPEDPITGAIPPALRRRVGKPLAAMGLETLEDLYECIANLGGNWYRQFPGVLREDAAEIVRWLSENGSAIGEVTERFYPPGLAPRQCAPEPAHRTRAAALPAAPRTAPIEELILPSSLSGEFGENRGHENSLQANNDREAIEAWLAARAQNPNTNAQYRKEAERFLLWCTMELGMAMSSITAREAARYPKWLEELGRTDEAAWRQHWRLPQATWIGKKNEPRLSEFWRPFNGPLSASSRKSAMTILRLFFSFLVKTGYLRFSPFDQISAKVRLLPGEGAPKAFADRSLTPEQWEEILSCLEDMEDSESKARLAVILSLGKGLGMRASEIMNATAGWICVRRIGDEDMRVIEIVGKGDKIRRLPLSDDAADRINEYLAYRKLPPLGACPPETPLVASLGVGPSGGRTGISRSGLYRTLVGFFREAAEQIEEKSGADAAKLRASSTHWLRHTFATTALKQMDINVVQNAMGHASIGTTSRYLTPEEAQIARAMKKMQSL